MRALEGGWDVAASGVDPSLFFRSLLTLVPEGCLLSLEGGDQPKDLRAFLEEQSVAAAADVVRGTAWPRQPMFHVPVTRRVLGALAELADACASPEICDHLVVHNEQGVVLQWYDAFSESLLISSAVAEERVAAFCRELAVSFAGCGQAGAAEQRGAPDKVRR